MTRDADDLNCTSINSEALIDFANDALGTEDRITVARVLSNMPTEAAETFGFIADREELLLALGVQLRMDEYPSLPAPLPEIEDVKPKRDFGFGIGISLAAFVLIGGLGLMNFQSPQRTADTLLNDALQANTLAELRLNMASMDEDTMVDPIEIQRLAGLTLPEHPSGWVLHDTQVIPADDGVSLLRTYEIGNDGIVTLYIARGTDGAPKPASRLALADGQGAWFRHAGSEYVLIGRHARAPLDDEAALLLASFTPV